MPQYSNNNQTTPLPIIPFAQLTHLSSSEPEVISTEFDTITGPRCQGNDHKSIPYRILESRTDISIYQVWRFYFQLWVDVLGSDSRQKFSMCYQIFSERIICQNNSNSFIFVKFFSLKYTLKSFHYLTIEQLK